MVKQKMNGQHKKRHLKSANSANARALPDTHWAHAVAMLTEQVKAGEQEKPMQPSEAFSEGSDLDIIRVRTLSSHI